MLIEKLALSYTPHSLLEPSPEFCGFGSQALCDSSGPCHRELVLARDRERGEVRVLDEEDLALVFPELFDVRLEPLLVTAWEVFFGGTFAPFRRASDNPIAMACFALLTLRPDLPD
ncbi:MAG: hypothetical protein JO166_01945 [Deltaproteobacteria bacterium]|nr:hypothetical protein [Deltaproteobacteria bacterium]